MFGFEAFHLLYISCTALPPLVKHHQKFVYFITCSGWQLPAHVTFWENILETSSHKQKRTNTASCTLRSIVDKDLAHNNHCHHDFHGRFGKDQSSYPNSKKCCPKIPKNTDDALRQKKEKIENEESYIFEPELHRVVVFVVIPYTSKSSAHKDGTLPKRNNGNFN